MKGSMLAVMTVLMAVGLSFGQQRGNRNFGNPEENAKRQTERLTKELNLSPAQKDSVYTYTLAQSKAVQQAFQDHPNGDRQQAREELRTLRGATDKKILAVLDTEQQATYQKLKEERTVRMKQGNGRNRSGNR